MADLAELLERVKAATGPNHRLEEDLFYALDCRDEYDMRSPPNYTVSLDAALALVERMLPGWIIRADLYPGRAVFGVERTAAHVGHQAEAPTRPLALLAALLSALIAQAAETAVGGDHPATLMNQGPCPVCKATWTAAERLPCPECQPDV